MVKAQLRLNPAGMAAMASAEAIHHASKKIVMKMETLCVLPGVNMRQVKSLIFHSLPSDFGTTWPCLAGHCL